MASSKKRKIARGGRYSRKNPPSSVVIALDRIQEITDSINDIKIQLERTSPSKFASEAAFTVWRVQAIRAEAAFQSEVNYLDKWVSGLQTASAKSALQHLKPLIHDLAQRMQSTYQERYNEGCLPPGLTVALERRQKLRNAALEFQSYFSLLKEAAEKAGVGKDTQKRIRRPMALILEQLRAEIILLSQFIDQKRGGRVDWAIFMISIVDRALVSGFVISDVERDLLAEIRESRVTDITIE